MNQACLTACFLPSISSHMGWRLPQAERAPGTDPLQKHNPQLPGIHITRINHPHFPRHLDFCLPANEPNCSLSQIQMLSKTLRVLYVE